MLEKIEGKNRGGEGTTPMTTTCPEAGTCTSVQKKREQKIRSKGPRKEEQHMCIPAKAMLLEASEDIGQANDTGTLANV